MHVWEKAAALNYSALLSIDIPAGYVIDSELINGEKIFRVYLRSHVTFKAFYTTIQ